MQTDNNTHTLKLTLKLFDIRVWKIILQTLSLKSLEKPLKKIRKKVETNQSKSSRVADWYGFLSASCWNLLYRQADANNKVISSDQQ